MYCPVCRAEFRKGITMCSDCHVALVPEPSGTGPDDEQTYSSFWSGDDTRVCTELCAKLKDAGVCYKIIRREDHLFNLNLHPKFEVAVPPSLFGKAKEAVGKEDDPEEGDEAEGQDGMELPAVDEVQEERDDWDPAYGSPEDATLEVWSGDNSDLAEALEASFRENQIYSRCDGPEDGTQKVFVLPEDGARAREIVREILEASPPE